jgi:hypothetical protein
VPVKVIAARPRIEAGFVAEIVAEVRNRPNSPAWAPDEPGRVIPLAQVLNESGQWVPLLTLQRLGCDDSLLASALVWELKLRRPELFPENAAPSKGAVALISEWDMLYGRAIPHSFEKAFVNQGGNRERLLIVARQSLVVIFAISFGVLLTSTFLIRRSADYARQSATMWLGKLLFDERLHHGESFSVEGMLAAAAKFDEKNVGGFAFSGRN